MSTDDDIPAESTVVDDKVQDEWGDATVAQKKKGEDRTPAPAAAANGVKPPPSPNGGAKGRSAPTIRAASIPAPPPMARRAPPESRMTSQGRPAMAPPDTITPPNAEIPAQSGTDTNPLAAAPTQIREHPQPGTNTRPATQMAKLVVIGGTDRGREFVLIKPETSIGRGTDNEIVLTDIAVSRRHFILTFDGQRFGVRDLGSGNGTILNGTRVAQVSVRDGDQIEIGNTLMRFEHPDGALIPGPAPGPAPGSPAAGPYPLQPPPHQTPYPPHQQQASWVASGGPPVGPPVPLPPNAPTYGTQLPYGSFGQPPPMPQAPQRHTEVLPPGPPTAGYSQQPQQPVYGYPEGAPPYDDRSATALRAGQKKKMIIGGLGLMGACILIAVIAALVGGGEKKPSLSADARGGGGGGGGGGGSGAGPGASPSSAPVVSPSTSQQASPSPSGGPIVTHVVQPAPSPSPIVISPVKPSPSPSPAALVSPSPSPAVVSPSPSPVVVKPSPSPVVKPSPSPIAVRPKPSPSPTRKPDKQPVKPDKPDKDPEPIVSGKAKDLLKQSQAQYKAKNFAAAAQSLRLAAEQQSGAAADKTRSQASQIASLGETLTAAGGASGSQAIKLYEGALKTDASVGKGAHAGFIHARLVELSKTEASKAVAAGKLENAYSFANIAEKHGGSSDPIVQKVRLALELKAKELYQRGQSTKGEAAKASWRRILKIVPATSPWYQKAYAAVNAAPAGGVDEDEEQ